MDSRPNIMGRIAHAFLLLGLAILGWQAVTSGLAIALRHRDPGFAVRMAPHNALALAELAEKQVADDPKQGAATASLALMRDATNASAAGTLSIARAATGDRVGSAKLLAYSQALSRRDLPTQLWAIELAVERGDIPKALHHYDVALRVGKTMPTLLFPVLAKASEDPAIRTPLIRMIASGAPWSSSFLDYLSSRTTNVVAAAELVGGLSASGVKVPRGPVNILVQRLMEANQLDRAWRMYASANPGAKRIALRNGDFNERVEMPTLFDWQFEDGGDVRAEIMPGERGGEMHLEARSGAGGTVARQRLVLPIGDYRLGLRARPVEGAEFGNSNVEIICLPTRNRIMRLPLAGSASAIRQTGFTVPAGCNSQSIEVSLAPGSIDGTIEGSIDDIILGRRTQH